MGEGVLMTKQEYLDVADSANVPKMHNEKYLVL